MGVDEVGNTATSTPTDFRPDIQGLRAVAVLLVVGAHASIPGLGGGILGVDVFFVISGYVIANLLLRQPPGRTGHHLVSFYAGRVRRIAPAATVVLVATMIVAYFALKGNFDPSVLVDARWASLFAANIHFIRDSANYFVPGLAPSLLTHFWSLAVEEQFYWVFPLLLLVVTSARPGLHHRSPSRRDRGVVAAVVLIVVIVASSLWAWHEARINPVAAYFSPFTRFWELALGAVVALIPVALARRTPRVNAVVGVLALGALGAAVWHFQNLATYPGLQLWWPCGATALLLWTGTSSSRGFVASWLSWRPVRYIGDISYSLYLYHFAWIVLPLQLVHPWTVWWARIPEIAGAFVCAVASYHLLENPLRHSTRLRRDNLTALLLLALCIGAVWDTAWWIGKLAHVA